MRVGILGGTFDPVHLGHLIVAEQARVRLDLDRVIFIPAGQPWLRAEQPAADGPDRLRMVELAVESNPAFEASSQEVDRPGPTRILLQRLHSASTTTHGSTSSG